ncbi:hypothetical protein [Kiloniella majae]|uniref:hypothetical protein n=1 Tax=Kiloniella majae TaxID=1938558 RepID=UPI000A2791CA|nr:hypothetical protein [Kiloniella majae]
MSNTFDDLTNGVGRIGDFLGGIFDTAVDYGGKAIDVLGKYNVFEDNFRDVRDGKVRTMQASAGSFPVPASNTPVPTTNTQASSVSFQKWGLIVSVIGVGIALFALVRK